MKTPVPLKRFIQRWLWPLMPGWPDEGRRIVQGPHLRALLARVSSGNGRRLRCVFNAGAGEGGYSPLLLGLPGVESVVESDFGWNIHNPRRIDPKQVFLCSTLASIPLKDRAFDLVLCTEVLEHIEEHERALDEMARVISSGGWLLITVPTPPAVHDPAHVREGYRPNELTAMLTRRGFQIVDSRFCMYFWFRFVLVLTKRLPARCTPRILIRGLAGLDKLLPLGKPMDLMILARRTNSCESYS